MQDRKATVERVVCKVLLGQPESALEALGLSESGTGNLNQRPVIVQCCPMHRTSQGPPTPHTCLLVCPRATFYHNCTPAVCLQHSDSLLTLYCSKLPDATLAVGQSCMRCNVLLRSVPHLKVCLYRRASQAGSVLSPCDNSSAGVSGAMGQALDSMSGPSRAEAAAFVSNHSPEPHDLLPGLCLLTERWLERVSKLSCQSVVVTTAAAYVLEALLRP